MPESTGPWAPIADVSLVGDGPERIVTLKLRREDSEAVSLKLDSAGANELGCQLLAAAGTPLFDFKKLQREHLAWEQRNFGAGRAVHRSFFGIAEEVGELAHALLKGEQGIRGTSAEHATAAKDAIGDIILYLSSLASISGWDLQTIVEQTWAQVSRRDWRTNPTTGESD